jgi:hypothetical protein
MTFKFCNMALAVGATRLVFTQPSLNSTIISQGLLLSLSAVAFFLVNTVPVAIIISLTEAKNVLKIWGNIFQLSFPYFVASAAVAGLVLIASERTGWQIPLFVLPVMFGVYNSYKRYFAESISPQLKFILTPKGVSTAVWQEGLRDRAMLESNNLGEATLSSRLFTRLQV